MYKKIISIISAFAIVFSLIAPVFADASGETNASYWDHFIHNRTANVENAAIFGSLLKKIVSSASSQVCQSDNSPDNWHHTSDNPQTRDHNGQLQARCRYCSGWFNVDAADLEAAYQDYVQNDLKADTVNSAGKVLYTPSCSQVDYIKLGVLIDSTHLVFVNSVGETTVNNIRYLCNWNVTKYDVVIVGENNQGLTADDLYNGSYYPLIELKFNAPITGDYTLVSKQADLINYTGGSMYGSVNYSDQIYNYNSKYLNTFLQNDLIFIGSEKSSASYKFGSGFFGVDRSPVIKKIIASYYLPTFEITPLSDLFGGQDALYNFNTRAGAVCGELAVMGDNNTLTKVNTTIINETNNTYYNPTTDTTSTITDWSYNYTDRSYTLTLENGDEAQVVYGNDNVTITEGGNTYTYYYYVEDTTNNNNGGGSGGSGGGGSFFGNATGTDLWGAVGDTLGSLLLAPLRIIETVLVKVIGWLGSLAETIGDGISNLVETILGWFDSLPELFSGFLGFLTAIFPFIPEEAMVFITVGLAAVVIIGIIRALRRR